jgi:hypothetical protein
MGLGYNSGFDKGSITVSEICLWRTKQAIRTDLRVVRSSRDRHVITRSTNYQQTFTLSLNHTLLRNRQAILRLAA